MYGTPSGASLGHRNGHPRPAFRQRRESRFRRFGKVSTFGKMFPEIRRNAHPDAAGCPLKHGKMLTAIPRKALRAKGFQTALRISGSKRSSIRRRMPTEESKEPKGNKPEGPQPESRNPKHGWRETAEKRAWARFRDCREADSDTRRIPSTWTCHKQSSTVMARHGAQYGLHFDASRRCDRHKLSLTVATDPAPHCGRNTGCVLTGHVLGPSSRERPSGSRTDVRVTDGYEKSPRPA